MRTTEASRRAQRQSAVDKAEAAQQSQLAPAVIPAGKAASAAGPLIEFSTIAGEDPNEDVHFGDVPASCKCPHCGARVVTFIDYEASWVTYVLAFVVWISLRWMAFWALPLLWPAFKDVVHRCPRCLNTIETKSRINLPTFKTEVMTVKVGGCAILLSRKYLVICLGVIGTIGSFYCLRSTIQLNTAHEEHKGRPSMLTWDDFLSDCGPKTSLSHRPSTAKSFEDRYRRRSFKWQGEVRLIREGFDMLFMKTKSVMMLQMYPSRFRFRSDVPDVALLFGESSNKEVANLMPGDWVEFEATMSAHGYRGDPEVMVMWHINKKDAPHPKSSSSGAESPHDHHDAALEGHHDDSSHHSSADEKPASHGADKAADPAAEPDKPKANEPKAAETKAAETKAAAPAAGETKAADPTAAPAAAETKAADPSAAPAADETKAADPTAAPAADETKAADPTAAPAAAETKAADPTAAPAADETKATDPAAAETKAADPAKAPEPADAEAAAAKPEAPQPPAVEPPEIRQ